MVSDEDDYLGELEGRIWEVEGDKREMEKKLVGRWKGWLICIYIRSGRR